MTHARRLRYMDVPSGDRRAKGAQHSDQAPAGRPFFSALSLGRAKKRASPAGARTRINYHSLASVGWDELANPAN
jgi:hypothetical protein